LEHYLEKVISFYANVVWYTIVKYILSIISQLGYLLIEGSLLPRHINVSYDVPVLSK
jgi:hypothetical protein